MNSHYKNWKFDTLTSMNKPCRKVWLDKRGRDLFSSSFKKPIYRMSIDRSKCINMTSKLTQERMFYQHLITYKNRGQQTVDDNTNLLMASMNQRQFNLIIALTKSYFDPNSDPLLEHDLSDIRQFCYFLLETFPYFFNRKLSNNSYESERSPIICTNEVDPNCAKINEKRVEIKANTSGANVTVKSCHIQTSANTNVEEKMKPSVDNIRSKPSNELKDDKPILSGNIYNNPMKMKSFDENVKLVSHPSNKQNSDTCQVRFNEDALTHKKTSSKNQYSIFPPENLHYKHTSNKCSSSDEKIKTDSHPWSDKMSNDVQNELLVSVSNFESNLDLSPRLTMTPNENTYINEIMRVRRYLSELQILHRTKSMTDQEYDIRMEKIYRYLNSMQVRFINESLMHIGTESNLHYSQSLMYEPISEIDKAHSYLKSPTVKFLSNSFIEDSLNEEIHHYMKYLNCAKVKYLTNSISNEEYNNYINNFCKNFNQLQTKYISDSMRHLDSTTNGSSLYYVPKDMSAIDSANEEIYKFKKYINCAKIKFIKNSHSEESFSNEINQLSDYLNKLNMNYLQESITHDDYDAEIMKACRYLNEIQTKHLSHTISFFDANLTPKFTETFQDGKNDEIFENVCKYLNELQIKHLSREITHESYDNEMNKICKYLNDLNIKRLSNGIKNIETKLLPNISKTLSRETIDENLNKIIQYVNSPRIRYITQSITNEDSPHDKNKDKLKTPRIKSVESSLDEFIRSQSKDAISLNSSALNCMLSNSQIEYELCIDKVCNYLNDLRKRYSSRKISHADFDNEVKKTCQYLNDVQRHHIRSSMQRLYSRQNSKKCEKVKYLSEPIGIIQNEDVVKHIKSELNTEYTEEMELICDYLNKIRFKYAKKLITKHHLQLETKKIIEKLNKLQINFITKSFNIFESFIINKFSLNFNNNEDLTKICSCIRNSQTVLIHRIIDDDISHFDKFHKMPQFQFIVKLLNNQEFKKDRKRIDLHINNVINKYNAKLNDSLMLYFYNLNIKMISIGEAELDTSKTLTNEINADEVQTSTTDRSLPNAVTDITFQQFTKSMFTEEAYDETLSASNQPNSISSKSVPIKQKYLLENDLKMNRLFHFESKATSASTNLDYDFLKPIEYSHNKLDNKYPKESKTTKLEKHKLDKAITEEDDRSLLPSVKTEEELAESNTNEMIHIDDPRVPQKSRKKLDRKPKTPDHNYKIIERNIDGFNHKNQHEQPILIDKSSKYHNALGPLQTDENGKRFMDIYNFKMHVNPDINLMDSARNFSMRTQDGKSGIYDVSTETRLSETDEANAIILVNFDTNYNETDHKCLVQPEKTNNGNENYEYRKKPGSNTARNNDFLFKSDTKNNAIKDKILNYNKLVIDSLKSNEVTKISNSESEDNLKYSLRNPVNIIGSVIYKEISSMDGLKKLNDSKISVDLNENYNPKNNSIESQLCNFSSSSKSSKLDDQQIRKFQFEGIVDNNILKPRPFAELSTINEIDGQTTTMTGTNQTTTTENLTDSYDASQVSNSTDALKGTKRTVEIKPLNQITKISTIESNHRLPLNNYSDIYDEVIRIPRQNIVKTNWKNLTENYKENLMNINKILINIIDNKHFLSIVIFLMHESLCERLCNNHQYYQIISDHRTSILSSKIGVIAAAATNNEAMEYFLLNIAHFMEHNHVDNEILASMQAKINEFLVKINEDIDKNIQLAITKNQVISNLLDFIAYAVDHIKYDYGCISKSKCTDVSYFNPKKSTLASKILCITFSWIRNNELQKLGYEKIAVDDKTVENAKADLLKLKNWLTHFIEKNQNNELKLEVFRRTHFYLQYLQYGKFVQKRSTDITLNEFMGSPEILLSSVNKLVIDDYTVRQAAKCCLKQSSLKWVHDSEEESVEIELDHKKLKDEVPIKQLLVVIFYWGITNDLINDPNSVEIKLNPRKFFTEFDFERFTRDLMNEDCDFPLIMDEFFVRVKIYCSNDPNKRLACPLNNLKLIIRQLDIDEFLLQCMDKPIALLELLRSTKKWVKKYLATVNMTPNASILSLPNADILKDDDSIFSNIKEGSQTLTSSRSDDVFKNESNDHIYENVMNSLIYNHNNCDCNADNDNDSIEDENLKILNTNNSSVLNH